MTESKKTNYNPISCSYYDELEALATKKETCLIIFMENDKESSVTDTITDFKIIDKVEYMILGNGQDVRLDTIISVNGKKLSDNRYC